MLKKVTKFRKRTYLALASLIFLLLQDFGYQITPEHYNTYVELIGTILIMIGVVTNSQND